MPSLRKELPCLAALRGPPGGLSPGMCLPACDVMAAAQTHSSCVAESQGGESQDRLLTPLSHKFLETSGKSLDFSNLMGKVEPLSYGTPL